jgi:presenilin-like A22 family membrane protease
LSPDGSWWKRKIILNVRVCEILSFILAGGFMSLYLITSAWYISDLLSIFIMATIAKLFKFKNLKYAYLYMLICVLLDGTAAALVLFRTK